MSKQVDSKRKLNLAIFSLIVTLFVGVATLFSVFAITSQGMHSQFKVLYTVEDYRLEVEASAAYQVEGYQSVDIGTIFLDSKTQNQKGEFTVENIKLSSSKEDEAGFGSYVEFTYTFKNLTPDATINVLPQWTGFASDIVNMNVYAKINDGEYVLIPDFATSPLATGFNIDSLQTTVVVLKIEVISNSVNAKMQSSESTGLKWILSTVSE